MNLWSFFRAREAIWSQRQSVGGSSSTTHSVDLAGDGRGEKQGLSRNLVRLGQRLDDLDQLPPESLVEQSVGFVKHQRF